MSGFISHIIDRHTDQAGNISPHLPGRFEPIDIPAKRTSLEQNLLIAETQENNTDEGITISQTKGLAQPGAEGRFSMDEPHPSRIKPVEDMRDMNTVSDRSSAKSREELPKLPAAHHNEVHSNTESTMPNTPGSVPYITRHIERLVLKENTEVPVDPSGEHSHMDTKSTTADVMITSEKKPMIWPSFTAIDSKNINANLNSSHVIRPTPDPKLVIGKITVEIVQPEKPAPVKVINRIVHAAPVSDSSRNKLSFGLGQL